MALEAEAAVVWQDQIRGPNEPNTRRNPGESVH
jgi:hypothetical protein